MNATNIEWTHVFGPGTGYTWNPVTGCTNGCEYCYARRLAETRLAHAYPNGFFPTFWPDRIEQPMQRKQPSGIFVTSMGDLWDPHVPQEWRDRVWDVVKQCPQHVFMCLTKQPQNITIDDAHVHASAHNLWFGVSSDGGPRGAVRPWLLREGVVPYDGDGRLFGSFEPLLHWPSEQHFYMYRNPLQDMLSRWGQDWMAYDVSSDEENPNEVFETLPYISWLIVGAQTGPGALLPQAHWVDTIIKQAGGFYRAVFLKNNLRPVLGDNLRQEWPKRMTHHE